MNMFKNYPHPVPKSSSILCGVQKDWPRKGLFNSVGLKPDRYKKYGIITDLFFQLVLILQDIMLRAFHNHIVSILEASMSFIKFKDWCPTWFSSQLSRSSSSRMWVVSNITTDTFARRSSRKKCILKHFVSGIVFLNEGAHLNWAKSWAACMGWGKSSWACLLPW